MGIPPQPLHPAVVPAAKPLPELPLISTSPANQSTAAASSGGAAGAVVVGLWVLSLWHITVPPEVAVAAATMIAALFHWVMITFGTTKEPQT